MAADHKCSNCGHWLVNHDFDFTARVRTGCLRCPCVAYSNTDGYQVGFSLEEEERQLEEILSRHSPLIPPSVDDEVNDFEAWEA